MTADLILLDARVYTMDGARPAASAVAVAGRHILAVGTDAEIEALAGPTTRTIRLQGRALLPALIDAHVHFGWAALAAAQRRLDLDNLPKQEILAQVAARALETSPGRWILGGGWNQNVWPEPILPTAADLDAVAPEHPVLLKSKSYHATWVNSRALDLAGITASTPDPPGGEIVRDPGGRPTGILLEDADDLAERHVPEPAVDETVDALRPYIEEARRRGLAGVHDPGHQVTFQALQVLHQRGELGLRVLMHVPKDNLGAAVELGLRSGLGDEYLRVGGVKLFADGALGPRTAAMLSPYEGTDGNRGILTLEPEELHDLVRRAHQAGLTVAIHAIGDAANRVALDAIEAAQGARGGGYPEVGPGRVRLPNRIEHVQLLHPDDLPRLARLGVVASMQPIHATSDMDMAEQYWGRRSDLAYAWRSLLDSGAHLAFGSDCPVETMDPLQGIHAAVTRRRADGRPGPEGWTPAQRLSVTQAVHAYTLGAAYASGESGIKGSITPGKLADLLVLSRDIFRIPPEEILEAAPYMMVFDGQLVLNP
jgi:hypothetical protein